MKKAALLLAQRVRPKSPLGEACKYLLNQWDTMIAHCDHGCTRLDNNLMENAIRPSVIGKKNFLFIGHPDAGDRSAIIYSIIVSCERRRIDPLAYLRDMLSRLPTLTNRDDLGALTPARWQPAVAPGW
jgi:transposase